MSSFLCYEFFLKAITEKSAYKQCDVHTIDSPLQFLLDSFVVIFSMFRCSDTNCKWISAYENEKNQKIGNVASL